ncbi:P-loop containing nucleoside triphosphate hydrolase protein [Dichotomopilus funicola]|uniref:P-loop containing nucleoside triphosphate hydrolase protein n=1 Tax=Dichotomopilus funicola TaxID=1934379 RepID=A0AAN6ZJA8_9PEZI|nr:P-loop containing nucleoside triphosphate hydrolase protein [Dichotomopilus funicola]
MEKPSVNASVVYGQLINAFNSFAAGTTPGSDLRTTIAQFTLYYVYCAIGIFIFIYIATVGFYYVGERIARALRRAYLRAVLRQNMAFFDGRSGTGEITLSIMSDMGTIQEAITSKISVAVTALANFASAFVIMYVVSWRTALVLSPTFVVMLAVVMVCGRYAVKHHKAAMGPRAQAAGLAEESIGSVREVTAFGIQGFLVEKYHGFLQTAGREDVKSRDSVAYMIAWSNAMPCLVYALSFWAGSIFLVRGQTSVSAIATTTLAIIISAFAIIRIAPSFQALTSTIAGSSKILGTINRRSAQDPFSEDGERLLKGAGTGDIVFRDVDLVYPSREDVAVLDRVNIRCPAGKTTAIVGPSGSGKSSIVSLLERYYEPTGGVIAVITAAQDANAHDFITHLAQGYETNVGQAGLQLSGGQRQRIALARALIRQPSILLLDEATSALDSKSEAVVQAALDAAAKDRTTIVIAHRLSTVRDADQIVVMESGRVVEVGTHGELMEKEGVYAGMVRNQQVDNGLGGSLGEDEGLEVGPKDVSTAVDEKSQSQSVHEAAVEETAGTDNAEAKPKLGLWSTLRFIYRVNAQERGLLALGTVSAIIAGFGIPVQSIFFAKLLDSLALEPGPLRESVNLWAVKASGQDAAAYASETVRLVRTVAALGMEEYALTQYDEILSQRAAASLRSMLLASALYAASQSVVFLCAALAFWYGGQLVSTGEYNVFQFYICFVALISGAQTAGSIFSYAPDASKAMHASRELEGLLAGKAKMVNSDTDSSSGAVTTVDEKAAADGVHLELDHIDFRYPSRPNHRVLQDFGLDIAKGQYVALVGPSGCGKSTILALLERFYDPDKGEVRADGVPLPGVDVQAYRQKASLVSQGAALYSGTIRENVALGAGGDVAAVTEEAIVEACKQANIHEFVVSLPDGLNTLLGARGTLVSGGQRQRLAIARALIRQPQILLLDEATSALDPESERLVQEALDGAAHGRTTVAVAHRLSSIRAADVIHVLDAGRIVESGRHEALMAKRGVYWDLVKMQNL